MVSNPSLCALISKWLGTEAWIRNVDLLPGLREYAADADLQQEWMMVLSRLDKLQQIRNQKYIMLFAFIYGIYFHVVG